MPTKPQRYLEAFEYASDIFDNFLNNSGHDTDPFECALDALDELRFNCNSIHDAAASADATASDSPPPS